MKIKLDLTFSLNVNQASKNYSKFFGRPQTNLPVSCCRSLQSYPSRKSLSMSQTSLNRGTLDLDDMTSTETAKLLKKQFAKLKVKASNLKVKDTELKQRFANLQNQRGRVCGYGGGITKSKNLRSSPILL